MLDFVKKSMYIGLGIAGMTKEKIESLSEELSKRTKLSEEEGKKLADYLQDESEKAKGNLRKTVEDMVDSACEKLPCRKCIGKLEARIAELEKVVGMKTAAVADCDPEACEADDKKNQEGQDAATD